MYHLFLYIAGFGVLVFSKGFCVYNHKRYWITMILSFGVKVTLASLKKWKGSLLSYSVKEFVKIAIISFLNIWKNLPVKLTVPEFLMLEGFHYFYGHSCYKCNLFNRYTIFRFSISSFISIINGLCSFYQPSLTLNLYLQIGK